MKSFSHGFNSNVALVTKIVATLAVTIMISGCVHGPKRENDTALSYLNGENYQAPTEGLPLALTRQSPVTHISGMLLIDTQPLPEPLKYQTLILARGQTEVDRVMTDAQGRFIFSGEIPNGSYAITLVSERFRLNTVLNVTAYKTEGLKLIATQVN